MFKLNEMLKQSDGFHVVTIHSTDVMFRNAMLEVMKAKGWETHSFSQLDDTTFQWAFVTAAKKKELHERHLHSVRNSLGSAEKVMGKKPGILDGIIARVRSGPLSRRFKPEPKEDVFFDILDIHHSREVPSGHVTIEIPKQRPGQSTNQYVVMDLDRSFSEQRAEDLERQQRERRTAPPEAFDDSAVRESYPPRHYINVFATPTQPTRHEGRVVDASENRRDDDDYSRRSSPAPISDPSPPSDYGSGGGGSAD